MARLIILSGARRGQRFELPPGIMTIGRSAGNSIALADESVASQHLLLSIDPEGCRIKDRSGGGTAVNGSYVITASLKEGDVIKLGDIELRFEEGTPIPKPAPSQITKPTPGRQAAKAKREGPRFEDVLREQQTQKKIRLFEIELGPILLWSGMVALCAVGIWAAFNTKPPPPKKTKQVKYGTLPGMAPPGQPATTNVTDAPETDVSPKLDPRPGFTLANEPPPLPYTLPVGAAKPDASTGRVYSTSQGGAQAAVDAAQPGDAVVFDSPEGSVTVRRPLRDVQFIGGTAAWKIEANLTDCQFFWHRPTAMLQTAGKLERCAFYQSHGPATHLIHADAVTFYHAGRRLDPGDKQVIGGLPQLWLRGFVRGVTVHKPIITPASEERRWDMDWPPVVRVEAEDLAAHGHNTYILSPHVRGQTAWTPFHVARATGLTVAQLTSEGGIWADPLLELDYGIDCALVGTALAGQGEASNAGYLRQPEKLQYAGREEWGHNHANAPFRGAAIYFGGQRNRIIGHGDFRPWSAGRRAALPGLHYADGIVARDPFLQEWSAEHGGLNANFAEPKNIFRVQWRGPAPVFSTSSPEAKQRFPILGANLAQPVLVPLRDLRAPPPSLLGRRFSDLTGQPGAAIERALATGENVFLGPGEYELAGSITNGLVFGAGMERTVLRWPTNVDCAQRDCKGLLNLTLRGGRYGYNSQAGEGGPPSTNTALLLRVRFDGQTKAGVNLQSAVDQCYQDCEFINGRVGFTHGHDRTRGSGGAANITRLSLLNCSFRNLSERAVDLRPVAARTGVVGIHNCAFEDIADTAVRLLGGESQLVQNCVFRRVGRETSTNAVVETLGSGAVVLSQLDIENKEFPGSPVGILVSGRVTVSHGRVHGTQRALVSRVPLIVDHLDAPDGNYELPYGSFVTTSTFRNGDLKKGAMLVREQGQPQSVSLQASVQPLDATPPPSVAGVTMEELPLGHLVSWNSVEDRESGLLGYVVLGGGRELYRTPLAYDPGDSTGTPLLKRVIPTSFLDTNRTALTYEVRAINGANLISTGGQAALPRWGPMRARFLDRSSNEVAIAEITYRNRVLGLVDTRSRKFAPAELRRQGVPDECRVEPRGPALEPPIATPAP